MKLIKLQCENCGGTLEVNTEKTEVICPYCNHQFITDIDLEANSEIKCPECKNIIEFDWNEDEDQENSCKKNCNGCCDCTENEKSNFNNLQELKEIEIDLEDNDDDM